VHALGGVKFFYRRNLSQSIFRRNCTSYSYMSDTVVRELYTPDLNELAQVLHKGLSSNFKEVSVSVESCPDLTQPPYSLASPGFGGRTAIADIGGVLNVEYLQNTNKYHFDLHQISEKTKLPFFIGAGATKPDVAVAKDNSEWIPNANVKTGVSLSREAYVDKKRTLLSG